MNELNIAVVGNWCNQVNPVPPLRAVQPDSQSVVGAEAHGRLHLTKQPPDLVQMNYSEP